MPEQSTICEPPPGICHWQRPIGFLTAYVPEELFHAAGFTPLYLFHTGQDRGRARAHLPGFTCWVAGSALDRALAGEMDRLAGVVLGASCDTTQGLTDLWRRNVPQVFRFHFAMPQRLDGRAARTYLIAELRDLRERTAAHAGVPVSDDALQEAIDLYNRTRALVRWLYRQAAALTPTKLYDLVRAAFQMPKETYNQMLEDVLKEPASLSDEPPGPLLLVVGPALGDPALFDVVAQSGARVGGDLFDLGERYFAVDAAEEGDPLEALADRLLASLPTPTKHHPRRSRSDHLLGLVRERGARGVIFARQKFCEPHGFDYVQLSRGLDRAGVPHLLVELEQATQAGQLHTRVEAFVEMLG